AHGADYHVDATGGDDAKPGTTPETAWKSLGKVNATAFTGGDRILFKKGETWNGMLEITSSGTGDKPLIYSSYGTGKKPLINAEGKCRAAIWIHGPTTSYVTVEGFALTNFDGKDV